MRQILSYIFFLSFALTYSQQVSIDKKILDLLEKADIPGLSLSVIRDGTTTYSGSYGVKSMYDMDPVTEKTVFSAASLSKPVFAYALLQLVDEGKFDLDKPLNEYMPYPDIEHDIRHKKVTARMVLSHRSGLPNWRRGQLTFMMDPGTDFRYSGEGFVWLMRVIEELTGKNIDSFVNERIFEPLDMENTSYIWKDRFESDYAAPHDEDMIPASKYRPEEGNAAHSLQTTAVDYAKFLIAALKGKFVAAKISDEIFRIQSNVPEKINSSGAYNDSVFWGLGFGLQKTGRGMSIWHWGDNGTFKCFFLLTRDPVSGIVYFTNSSNGLSITPKLIKLILDEEVPAWDWVNYESYESPTNLIYKGLQHDPLEKVLKPFLTKEETCQDTNLIDENTMNRLGYRLMEKRKMEEAKIIFEMNTIAYPHSWNVYDSYAESCLKMGLVEEAISYYKKSLDLNPENINAKNILTQLDGPIPGSDHYRFELRVHQHARYVSVIGDFNNWNNLSTICRMENKMWVGYAQIRPGTYEYKFNIDGVSVMDPQNPESRNDGGWHRSVLTIPEKK